MTSPCVCSSCIVELLRSQLRSRHPFLATLGRQFIANVPAVYASTPRERVVILVSTIYNLYPIYDSRHYFYTQHVSTINNLYHIYDSWHYFYTQHVSTIYNLYHIYDRRHYFYTQHVSTIYNLYHIYDNRHYFYTQHVSTIYNLYHIYDRRHYFYTQQGVSRFSITLITVGMTRIPH